MNLNRYYLYLVIKMLFDTIRTPRVLVDGYFIILILYFIYIIVYLLLCNLVN